MCYSIFLSTDCPCDLGAEAFEHLAFHRDLDPEPSHAEILALLKYPHRWFLNRREYGGCSCHFRHQTEGTFGPPEDWRQESPDNIDATREAYRVFGRIVEDGYHLDLLNLFSGCTIEDEIEEFEVELGTVDEESFSFIEDSRFEIKR